MCFVLTYTFYNTFHDLSSPQNDVFFKFLGGENRHYSFVSRIIHHNIYYGVFFKRKEKIMKNLKTLAESQFPHISRGLGRGGDKKSAFTLAEVLITLGVIGVVAAITLAVLIQNYQKMVWTKQLQKSYSTLNQGFQKMLADDGVGLLSQTETFSSIGGSLNNGSNGAQYKSCTNSNALDSDNCKDFYKNLGKYFKIISIKNRTNYQTYYLDGSETPSYYGFSSGNTIYLADGSMIILYTFYSQDHSNNINNQMKGRVGIFNIDINGNKGPNKWGRDIFYFQLGDNGLVYPYGSHATSEYDSTNGDPEKYHWSSSNCRSMSACCPPDINGTYTGCAARVLEEGKMNY